MWRGTGKEEEAHGGPAPQEQLYRPGKPGGVVWDKQQRRVLQMNDADIELLRSRAEMFLKGDEAYMKILREMHEELKRMRAEIEKLREVCRGG